MCGSPPRWRTSMTCHRGRPTVGSLWRSDGRQAIRHLVTDAAGKWKGSLAARRQRRMSRADVPLSSAASWRRREAGRRSRAASPTTAARPPWRSPSSITARTSSSRRHSAQMSRCGGRPARARPGAKRSRRAITHRTIPPLLARRAAIEAVNKVAAASSLSVGAAGATSCSAATARPPPASRSSMPGRPKGRMSRFRRRPESSIRRTSSRRADSRDSRSGTEERHEDGDMRLAMALFSLCSACAPKESSLTPRHGRLHPHMLHLRR